MDHLIESSVEDLFASAVRAFPNTTKRQHATQPIIIEELHWTPFRGMKTLFIKGLARNENRKYNTIILFKNVDYDKDDVKIKANDGLIYNFGKLSLENTDVALRCNCQDFQWRFNYYNHLDKSLYGSKRSKYEGAGGPPANPSQMPGMCKHLMKTVEVLKESGIFEVNYSESNGSLEASQEEVSEAQQMWNLCHQMLSSYNGNMNYALADYCRHMTESGENPQQIGKILGISLVHSSNYSKLSVPVDRNKIFEFLGKLLPETCNQIKQSALNAYSTYEMRPFTMNTIKRLG